MSGLLMNNSDFFKTNKRSEKIFTSQGLNEGYERYLGDFGHA